jgi:hypothetical protein
MLKGRSGTEQACAVLEYQASTMPRVMSRRRGVLGAGLLAVSIQPGSVTPGVTRSSRCFPWDVRDKCANSKPKFTSFHRLSKHCISTAYVKGLLAATLDPTGVAPLLTFRHGLVVLKRMCHMNSKRNAFGWHSRTLGDSTAFTLCIDCCCSTAAHPGALADAAWPQ